MEWIIEYYRSPKGNEPVADFIDSLPLRVQPKVLRAIEILSDYGVLLKEPYTRQVRGKIRELRIKDDTGNIRVLYFTFTGKRFVLLHAFIKKTAKTPESEIATAEKRMKDFVGRYGGEL
jgi:phage-related protein